MKYLVFIIYCYEFADQNGDFRQSVECQLIADTKEEALKRAEELVPGKKHYYLRTIIEKYREGGEYGKN